VAALGKKRIYRLERELLLASVSINIKVVRPSSIKQALHTQTKVVGMLSLANRLGLGAGDMHRQYPRYQMGTKPVYVFRIGSAENVVRKKHRNTKNKSAHSTHNLTKVTIMK
jgi:hypothetical protein